MIEISLSLLKDVFYGSLFWFLLVFFASMPFNFHKKAVCGAVVLATVAVFFAFSVKYGLIRFVS